MTKYEQWLLNLGVERADLSEEQEAEYRRLAALDGVEDPDGEAADEQEREQAPAETSEQVRIREIREIAPRGMEAFADELIVRTGEDGKLLTVEAARKAMLEKVAENSKPAGSPEPPEAQRKKKGEGDVKPKVKDVDDATIVRSLTG